MTIPPGSASPWFKAGEYSINADGYLTRTSRGQEQSGMHSLVTKSRKPRKRLLTACRQCRRRKIKCEPGEGGCRQCTKLQLDCVPMHATAQQPEAASHMLDGPRNLDRGMQFTPPIIERQSPPWPITTDSEFLGSASDVMIRRTPEAFTDSGAKTQGSIEYPTDPGAPSSFGLSTPSPPAQWLTNWAVDDPEGIESNLFSGQGFKARNDDVTGVSAFIGAGTADHRAAQVEEQAPLPSTEQRDPEINCVCGFRDDDGNIVECDSCKRWQHIICYYPDYSDALPADLSHYCVECEPSKQVDRHKAALRQQRTRRRQFSYNVANIPPPRPDTSQSWNEKTVASPSLALNSTTTRRNDTNNDLLSARLAAARAAPQQDEVKSRSPFRQWSPLAPPSDLHRPW